MPPTDECRYRLRLADGFLREARQDLQLERWRSCVDNSQLAVENAAKAVLALLAPVARTHHPAPLLREAISENRFPREAQAAVERIAECAELLGPDVYIESDYGDEASWRTPWELFGENDALSALQLSEDAVQMAHRLIPDEHA